jgi:hypothetical protein
MEVGMKTVTGIKIDREFQNLIPALSTEEREQLEANIVEHGGARDPLVVWQREVKYTNAGLPCDSDILLDGHNRYEICERLGLPYEVEHLEFDTRDDAADWIDRNQLGRRNLSRQDYKLLLGRRYNRTKKTHDEAGAMKGKAVDKMSTACALAAEHGVDEKTVRRAGKFQEAAAKLGIEKDIAAGKVKATEAAVVKAATALPKQPTREQVKAAREEVRQEKPRRRASKPAVEVFKAYPPTRCLEAVAFYAKEFLERCPTRADELRAALVELIASCDATK